MFTHDARLGLDLPTFAIPFEEMNAATQEEVLVRWETIRARIPDQIIRFERVISDILAAIHQEEDWDIIVAHFDDIADYASRIHELNTWYRIDQGLTATLAPSDLAAEHQHRET